MKATHWKDLLSVRYNSPGASFVTYCTQRIGAVIAAFAFCFSISANALTIIGLLLVLAGCGGYCIAETPAMLIGTALVWIVAYAFDCADGQLARATKTAGPYGGWLDLACDKAREVAFGVSILTVLLNGGRPYVEAALAAGIFMVGSLIFLQTASSLKSGTYAALKLNSIQSVMRVFGRNILDLPFCMLILVVLRSHPLMLEFYVVVYGMGQIIRSVSLANRRLKPSAIS